MDKEADRLADINEIAVLERVSVRSIERYMKRLKQTDEKKLHELRVLDYDQVKRGKQRYLYHIDATRKFIQQVKGTRRNGGKSTAKDLIASVKQELDEKFGEDPHKRISQEIILEKQESVTPPVYIDIRKLDFDSQKDLIQAICDRFTENVLPIRKICWEMGIKLVDFFYLINTNPVFKKIYDQSDQVREYIVFSELTFWEEYRILEKLRTKETTDVEIIYESGLDEQGNPMEIEKGKKKTIKKYFPPPQIINIAGAKKAELKSKLISSGEEMPMPEWDTMTYEQKEEKIKDLQKKIEEKKKSLGE